MTFPAYSVRLMRGDRAALESAFFGILLAILVGLSTPGCKSTLSVVPDPVASTVISFDGNSQNAGLLEWLPDGSKRITAGARDRYNALVEIYSADFVPAIAKDSGIRPLGDGTFAIDKEHLVYFGRMATRYRSGIDPTKK